MLTFCKLSSNRNLFKYVVKNKNLCMRHKSNKSRYSETINLPRTDFVASVKNGVAAKREKDIQVICGFDNLYKQQWEARKDKELFVLHDGPPYANGKPHVGHVINKISKDITNRYNVIKGNRVYFQPGWDCHGLPIELKALKDGEGNFNLPPLKIREKAKSFAEEAIGIQKKAFKRWGVMGDWDHPYMTMDPEYEVAQLEIFFSMFEKGLIYQDYLPVYWSPSSRTALAEAELEYVENHVSKALHVKFPIAHLPANLDQSKYLKDKKVFVIIWTTTPWTLPINQAICYNDEIDYALVEDVSRKEVFIVEREFSMKLESYLNRTLAILGEMKGIDLDGSTYIHPLTREELRLYPGGHVSSGKGTGFVHTSPAHGHDDFDIAKQYKIDIKNMVNMDGSYNEEAGPDLKGKIIGFNAEDKIIDMFKNYIVHKENFQHSYPYDWRTKKPVIIRASKQWFVKVKDIKENAKEHLDKIQIIPASWQRAMYSSIQSRNYWCISRQRVWGVPIPVFFKTSTGEPVLNREIMDHVLSHVKTHGTNCWWTMGEKDLLPQSFLDQTNTSASDYVKGSDILDIWFDSGSSWTTMQKDGIETSDVYLEGLDQFGAWFQTSLLTSLAVNGKAPYKKLVIHGFTVDEEGKKMSKSLGNVVDPEEVIDGGKNKQTHPSYGVDVLRWWTAHSHLNSNSTIGPTILNLCNEEIFKVRKIFQFLLGNIQDLKPGKDIQPFDALWPQDQYILHKAAHTVDKAIASYDEYDYKKVLLLLEVFMNSDLSAYIYIIKDRLYCNNSNDKARKCCQTALFYLAQLLAKVLAPIVPHLAEEVFLHVPTSVPSHANSIFMCDWVDTTKWKDEAITKTVEPVYSIFEQLLSKLETDDPLQYEVVIYSEEKLYEHLKKFQQEESSCTSPLNEIMRTSFTHLTRKRPNTIPEDAYICKGECTLSNADKENQSESFVLVITPAMKDKCERCRRYTVETSSLCSRCEQAMTHGWDL